MKEKKHGRARERLRRRAAEQRVAREPHYLERSPEREETQPALRRGASGNFQPVQRVAHYIGSFPISVTVEETYSYVNDTLSHLQLRQNSPGKVVKLMVFPNGVKVFEVDGETLFMAHALMRILLAIGIWEKQLFALVARNPPQSGGELFCHCFHCDKANEADELSQLVAKAFKLSYASRKSKQTSQPEQGQPTNLPQPQLKSNHHPRQLQRPAHEHGRRQEAEKQHELERRKQAQLEQEEEWRRREALRREEQTRQEALRQEEERRKQEAAACEPQIRPAPEQQRILMAPSNVTASPITKRRVAHRPAAAPPTTSTTAPSQSQLAASNDFPSRQAAAQESNVSPAPVQVLTRDVPEVIAGSPRPLKMKTRVARSVHRKKPKTEAKRDDKLTTSRSMPSFLDSFADEAEKSPEPVRRRPCADSERGKTITDREKRNSLLALEKAALELASLGMDDDKRSSGHIPSKATKEDSYDDEEEEDIFDHEPSAYASVQEALESEAAALSEMEWFHAGIPRAIAMEILACQPPGVFMVRDSQSHQGSFALSLKSPNKGIIHYLIERTPSNSLRLHGEDVDFDDVLLLIDAHRRMPGILPCRLSTANVNPALIGNQRDGGAMDSSDDDEEDPDYFTVGRPMLVSLPEDDD